MSVKLIKVNHLHNFIQEELFSSNTFYDMFQQYQVIFKYKL
jgi:hypothetical protein